MKAKVELKEFNDNVQIEFIDNSEAKRTKIAKMLHGKNTIIKIK